MTTTAFALAGLGGFNAHGAGFLKAASDFHVVPDMITATSGQIVVVADWLQGKNLEQVVVDPALSRDPLAQLMIALCGDPGIFMPAYWQAIARWWTLPPLGENPIEAFMDRAAPAQLYVPTRKQADYQAIADTLDEAKINGKEIGIVFNAYDLQTGWAVLFGNRRAREQWPDKKAIPLATKTAGARGRASSRSETKLLPISADAVESALWLSLYGFSGLPEPHRIDGAYDRSCIVSELHEYDRVFVARPLAEGWLGRPPTNWLQVQDWQTEMWFSVGYKAEVDALNQINGLVAQGLLGAPYRIVRLIEIAPRTPAGYFNYFVEREAVFHRAYEEATQAFAAELP